MDESTGPFRFTVSRRSPGSWMRASSSLRKKLCWFESHYRHISLCSPGSWMRASSRLRKQTMLVRVPLFLYVAQVVECVLAVAFGNKLRWFQSHYRHISLCSLGSWTSASSILRNTQHSQKTDIHAPGGIRTHNLSRRGAVDPLSAYFFMYP